MSSDQLMNTVIILFILLASQSFANAIPGVYSFTYYGVQSDVGQYHPDSSMVLGSFQSIDALKPKNGTFFYDSRVKIDVSKATTHNEINLGLGYRGPVGSNAQKLFGMYGFWDVVHVQDYAFAQQATLGVEYLSPLFRFSTNAYLTQKDFVVDYVSDLSSTAIRSFDKHYFITNQTGEIATIKPLSGMDATCELPVYQYANQNFILQLGYKYFNRDNFITMQGPKLALSGESSIGKQTRRWELFWAHDDFHGSSAGITLLFRHYPERVSHYTPLELLYAQPVIRDIDIQLSYLSAKKGEPGKTSKKQSSLLLVEDVSKEIIQGLFDFYVINLDKDVDRLKAFREQFARMGLEFDRVDAVNGRYLNMQTLVADGKIAGKYAKKILPGEAGVCYSQMKVWESNRKNPKPYIVVFEDDVRLPDDFATKMANLSGIIDNTDFDVLFLGRTTHGVQVCRDAKWNYVGCTEKPYPVLNEPTERDPPITAAPYSYGAFAYIVPVKSTQKLIDAHQTIYHPCDVQWWDSKYHLNLKTVNPLWMDHHSTLLTDSHSHT